MKECSQCGNSRSDIEIFTEICAGNYFWLCKSCFNRNYTVWREMKDFNHCRENWGRPFYTVSSYLLLNFQRLRTLVGVPFIIHCGYEEGGHSEGSLHYTGMAVDFHPAQDFKHLAVLIDKLWWFGGVGFYPYWKNPGFHLDVGAYRRWHQKEGGEISISEGAEPLEMSLLKSCRRGEPCLEEF